MIHCNFNRWVFLLVVILSGCSKVTPGPPVSQPQPADKPNVNVAGVNSPADLFARLKQRLEQGHYEEVIDGARKASIQAKEDPIWVWRFQLLEARARIRSLDYDNGLKLLKIQPPAGLPVEEFVRKNIIVAEALCGSGKNRDNRDGIAALDQVKSMLAPPSTNSILNAEWLFFRGKCEPVKSEAARLYFEQANQLAHGQDKWLEAVSSGMLAFRLEQLERFDEALDRYKPALRLSREIGSPVLEERILGYMAQSYYQLGEFQEAEQYAKLAEKLAADLGRIDHRARHLIDVGVDEQSSGRLTEAEGYYHKAIDLAQTDYFKGAKEDSDDITSRSLNNLTVIELSRQSFDKAESYHRQAANLKKSGDDLLTWKLSEIDLALARKNFPDARAFLERLFSEKQQGDRLLWSAQERMARMYELMGNATEAEKWYRATIDTAVRSSGQLNREEYRASLLGNMDFFSNYIEFLVRNNRPEQALQVAEIGRAKALAATLDYNLPAENTSRWLDRIQAGLRQSGRIVLAYWESKTQLYIWLVTASQVKLIQQPIGVREIEKIVTGYQDEITQPRNLELSPASRRLYEILVLPFESLIPIGSQVVIIAHGNLYDINFESLVVPGPKLHYWIEDVWLENAISLDHVVHFPRHGSQYKKEMLAIGAAIQVDSTFPSLPNASEEIDRVTRFFPADRKQVFTGERATPQAFLTSDLGAYRYIHIAAHGTNIALEPMESAIILSPNKDNSYKLYARDVANLKGPIQTEVVTISSCYSAGVRTNDFGGAIGLSWAFLHAGAHQVVAALWKVDDAAMPQLMEQFYSALAKGNTARAALRDAKLAILRSNQYQSAFYWATLQLYSRE